MRVHLVHLSIYIYIYVGVCVYTHMCECVHASLIYEIYVYIYIYLHIYIYIYTYLYVYVAVVRNQCLSPLLSASFRTELTSTPQLFAAMKPQNDFGKRLPKRFTNAHRHPQVFLVPSFACGALLVLKPSRHPAEVKQAWNPAGQQSQKLFTAL